MLRQSWFQCWQLILCLFTSDMLAQERPYDPPKDPELVPILEEVELPKETEPIVLTAEQKASAESIAKIVLDSLPIHEQILKDLAEGKTVEQANYTAVKPLQDLYARLQKENPAKPLSFEMKQHISKTLKPQQLKFAELDKRSTEVCEKRGLMELELFWFSVDNPYSQQLVLNAKPEELKKIALAAEAEAKLPDSHERVMRRSIQITQQLAEIIDAMQKKNETPIPPFAISQIMGSATKHLQERQKLLPPASPEELKELEQKYGKQLQEAKARYRKVLGLGE